MTDPPDREPVSGLPPEPLTERQLAPLAAQSDAETVWVPQDRPETVYTMAGELEHEGDIMSFYIETGSVIVKYGYTSTRAGLAWVKFAPWAKDADDIGLIRGTLDEAYRPLEAGTDE